jgi:hypothetical protein
MFDVRYMDSIDESKKKTAILILDKTISMCEEKYQLLIETTVDRRHADYEPSDIREITNIRDILSGSPFDPSKLIRNAYWIKKNVRNYLICMTIADEGSRKLVEHEMLKKLQEVYNGLHR